MDSRVEQTNERHKKGFNCAQSVACTYCDLFGVDESVMYRITEAYGRGLGGTSTGTCGAVSGACAILSLSNSVWGEEKGKTKQGTYRLAHNFCTAFEEKNGSTLCKDLLGLGIPGVHRTCPECIHDAAVLLEQFLKEKA